MVPPVFRTNQSPTGKKHEKNKQTNHLFEKSEQISHLWEKTPSKIIEYRFTAEAWRRRRFTVTFTTVSRLGIFPSSASVPPTLQHWRISAVRLGWAPVSPPGRAARTRGSRGPSVAGNPTRRPVETRRISSVTGGMEGPCCAVKGWLNELWKSKMPLPIWL